MRRFTRLYVELDETNRTAEKQAAMERYFADAPPADAAWALYFLTQRRLKRLVNATMLRDWAAEVSGFPPWIIDESYDVVGDLGETIALLVEDGPEQVDVGLRDMVENRLQPLGDLEEAERKALLVDTWKQLDRHGRFLWNKLITGAFRVGVARTLVERAMANVAGVDHAVMAHRLMGDWQPSEADFLKLIDPDDDEDDIARPYPFCLAYAIEADPEALGPVDEWQVEWKWDGIRCQLIRRQGQTFVWSRGEDLVNGRFPEIEAAAGKLPDGTVLDGEALAWKDGRPLPFADMQRRIGRKAVSKKMLADVPVALIAYDILEHAGEDARERPMTDRRSLLEETVNAVDDDRLILSQTVDASSWAELEELRSTSRTRRVEGFMLKRKSSVYRVGRKKGDWWKWKVDPYTIDAVLIYAQRGSGRRAGLYTDYTFGLWRDGELVPVAKAYSGLTDVEIGEVDRFVRANTIDRFGPVRVVKPELVFELAFEGINRSSRHKSGVAVRFPRMHRWRTDKPPAEADTLENLLGLLDD